MANGNNIVKSLGGIDDPNALANALIALDPRLAPKATQPTPAPIPTMQEQQAHQQAIQQAQQRQQAFNAPGGMSAQLGSIYQQTQSGALAPNQLQGALQQAGVSETPSERQSVANALAIQQGTQIPNVASPTGQFGGAPSTVGSAGTVTAGSAPVDMDALNQAIDAALGRPSSVASKPSGSAAAPATQPLASSDSSGGSGRRVAPVTQPAQVPKVQPFESQPFKTPEGLGGALNPMTQEELQAQAVRNANLTVDPQRQEFERQLEQARLGTRQDIEGLFGPSFDRAVRNLEEQMQAARERQVGVTSAGGKLFSPLGRGEIALAEKPYAQAIGDVNLQQAQAAQQLAERLELQQNQLAQQIQQLEARRGQLTATETLQLQQMERQFTQNEVQRQFANHMAEQGFGLQTQAFNVGQDFDLARFLEGARQFGMDFGLRETAQNTLLPLQATQAQQAIDAQNQQQYLTNLFREQVGIAPELTAFQGQQAGLTGQQLSNTAAQQGIDFNAATKAIREQQAQAQLEQMLAAVTGAQNQNQLFPMKLREQTLNLEQLEQGLANAPGNADLQRRLTEAQIANYTSQAGNRGNTGPFNATREAIAPSLATLQKDLATLKQGNGTREQALQKVAQLQQNLDFLGTPQADRDAALAIAQMQVDREFPAPGSQTAKTPLAFNLTQWLYNYLNRIPGVSAEAFGAGGVTP